MRWSRSSFTDRARRMAARELLEEVELTREKVLERIEKRPGSTQKQLTENDHNYLFDHLPEELVFIWKRSGWANGNYREFIKKGKRKGKQERGNTMDMFFTQRKLEGRIRELGEYRYRDVRNFESFLAKEDKSGLVNPDVPTDFTGWDRICTGSDWKGRDLYLWLHGEMKVPSRMGRKARGRRV